MRIVIREILPCRLREFPSRFRYRVLEGGIVERKASSSAIKEIRVGVDAKVVILSG
jgi:hypothetical protein